VELLGILVGIATIVGVVATIVQQRQGNAHLAEQNRIMREQSGLAEQARSEFVPYKPPRWPLIVMAVMVILCWGAAVYGYLHSRNVAVPVANWDSYPLKRVEHRHFQNETVALDGNEYIDVTFENVSFMYHGKAPTRLNGIGFVLVKPGELAGAISTDNPEVAQTLSIVTAVNAAGGCNATFAP
jgi:hypothetical protein